MQCCINLLSGAVIMNLIIKIILGLSLLPFLLLISIRVLFMTEEKVDQIHKEMEAFEAFYKERIALSKAKVQSI